MKVDPNNPIYLLENCHIFLRNLAIFLDLIFLFVYWKRIKQISKIVLGCRSLPDCAMSTSPIGAGPTWSADKLHLDTTAAPTSSASKEAARAHSDRAPTPLRRAVLPSTPIRRPHVPLVHLLSTLVNLPVSHHRRAPPLFLPHRRWQPSSRSISS
jgi:hypothetical protein